MNWQPRDGQWVSTSLAVVGAHKTSDGRTVGIYQRARVRITPSVPKDGEEPAPPRAEDVPPTVFIVSAEDGMDLYTLRGREAKPVSFTLDELPDLQPVTEVDDIPASRRPEVPDGAKLRP